MTHDDTPRWHHSISERGKYHVFIGDARRSLCYRTVRPTVLPEPGNPAPGEACVLCLRALATRAALHARVQRLESDILY